MGVVGFMKKKKEPEVIVTRFIPIGDILKGKQFDSFISLRKPANVLVSNMWTQWRRETLKKHGVRTKKKMTRREMIELLEANSISIVKEDKSDKIYKGNVLIGEWFNERKIGFNSDGKMYISVKYSIL